MNSSVGADFSSQANKNATPFANHTPPQATSTSTPPGDPQLLQYSCSERGPASNDSLHSHTPTTDQSDVEFTNRQGTPTWPDVSASDTHAGSGVSTSDTHAGPGVRASDTHAGPDAETNSVHSRAPGQTLYTNYGMGVEVQAKEMEGSNEVGGDVAGTHFNPHKRTTYHSSSIAEKSNAKSQGEDNHNHSLETMGHLD